MNIFKFIRTSIYYKYLVPLLLLSVIGVCTSILLIILIINIQIVKTEDKLKLQTSDEVKKEIVLKNERLLSVQLADIEDRIDGVTNKVSMVGKYLDKFEDEERTSKKTYKKFVDVLFEEEPTITALGIYEKNNKEIYWQAKRDTAYSFNENLRFKADFSLLKKDSTYLSPIQYITEKNKPFVWILSPKFKEEKFDGYMLLRVKLDFIQKELDVIKEKDIGYLLSLLDEEKNIIVNPLYADSTKVVNEVTKKYNKELKELQRGSLFDDDLVTIIQGKYGWKLFSCIPSSSATAPLLAKLDALTNTFAGTYNKILLGVVFVLLGIIIGSIFLGIWLAKRITRPVIQLTNATNNIKEGNLDVNIDVYTEDEIGELSGSFNEMAQVLKVYRENLLSQNITIMEQSKQLATSNADLEQYAYTVSHDLKEPLRMMSSYSSLLKKKYNGSLDPSTTEYLKYIFDGSKRMEALIEDLLTYSKFEAKAKQQQFQKADLNELVAIALTNLKQLIKNKNAQITVAPLPSLNVKSLQIVSLFQNLIGNAIKYGDTKLPIIKIDARKHKRTWIFMVKDNGKGIPTQYLTTIFKPFERLHDKSIEGSGIGLATCKKVVQHHSGEIWADSIEGEGAIFYFTLPVDHC